MHQQLEELRNRALKELEGINSEDSLQSFKVKFLGKKGELTSVMKGIGALPADERPRLGQMVNSIRDLLD